ncbi:MAG: TIGR00725 family protein [candidate division Zixibacteria bacterium]|nr:TIGR00725 family protein [candidate division Zixibacteria bacterium]MDH3938956.1 TIGR00725 family protein [candidate division Zixibacteria bacterium]
MSTPRKPVIAVIGAGKCSKKLRDMAFEVGKYVAENGGVLVCGGLGGIMEGAARGAKEAGGLTLGILPTDLKEDANEFIDIVIPTGFGEARNIMVVRSADAVIAFPGKFGTLTEMAFALHAKKPVVSVNAWRLSEEIHQTETPQEAAELAMKLAVPAEGSG